jgi:inorganic pyrophosphatase
MLIEKIPSGKDLPNEINVLIEIPMGVDPVKYELDKESGALFVDRFLTTAMYYPCNYGFIPSTLSEDGDPCDVLVLARLPIVHGAVVRARPIAVLIMEDESGQDEKVLAVPVSKLDPYFNNVQSHSDLPQIFIDQLTHFFEHYKDLEKGKWVKVKGWEGQERAKQIIQEAADRFHA